MGAIVAARDPFETSGMSAMFGAMPHRGSIRAQAASGPWTVAIAGDDAWLAAADGHVAAFTGVIDDGPGWARLLDEAGGDAGAALLSLFRSDGAEAVRDLRGVFTIVYIRGARLWAARDHLGFSPLFYGKRDGRIVASVQARPVAIGLGLSPQPDESVVEGVFWGDYGDDTGAFIAGVKRLPKASLLAVDDAGALSTRRYWDPARALESRVDGAIESVQEEFDDLMERAVVRSLGSDPVISLSGGVDAPAVAAYAWRGASRRGTSLPAALSAVYPDLPAVDEREYIELVADRFGMRLTTYRPEAGPLEGIERFVRMTDGPVPTVSLAESSEYYELARELGFRTVLTGEMAEFAIAMGSRTLDYLVARRRPMAVYRHLQAERARGVPLGRLAKNVGRSLAPASILARWDASRRPDRMARVPWLVAERRPEHAPLARSEAWRAQQISGFLGPGISVEADEAVQASVGVRVRRPWLDVDVWEFFISLPAEVKYPDGRYKGLAKQLLRGRVPDEILDRRDRTYFDDSFIQRFDVSRLLALLDSTEYRMQGVDYSLLRDRLLGRQFDLVEAVWAKDLAVVHAFMAQWT